MAWHEILRVGAEGGNVTLMGRREGNRGWQFFVTSDERSLGSIMSEQDGEMFELLHQTQVVREFSKAIALLDERYSCWANLEPLQVAPQFAGAVLQSVKERCDADCQLEGWMRVIDAAYENDVAGSKRRAPKEGMTEKIADRVKQKLMKMAPLSVVNLKELYDDFDEREFSAVRAALYNQALGTPVSKRSKSKIFFAIRMMIDCPDGSHRTVYLSLPGIPRDHILDDTEEHSTIEPIVKELRKKYGKETINYWGNAAQYRSVDQARSGMKKAVSRDQKSCRICDLLRTNSQEIPFRPVAASHMVSRKAIFWKALARVAKLKKSIFSDEAVVMLKKMLREDLFHSDEQYIIALCAEHDKAFLKALRTPVASEETERKAQTIADELNLSLF